MVAKVNFVQNQSDENNNNIGYHGILTYIGFKCLVWHVAMDSLNLYFELPKLIIFIYQKWGKYKTIDSCFCSKQIVGTQG